MIMLLLASLFLGACATTTSDYRAHDALLNSIGVDYECYVKYDSSLLPEQRDSKLRTLEAWRRWVDSQR